MTNSYYKISLDIHNHGSNVSLKAKHGDTGRMLYITLMDGSRPYSITSECYAVFTAKKADGKILYNKCSIEDNTIIYRFTTQTTSSVGKVECEIKLYGTNDKLITSAGFALIVEDTVYEDTEVESEKEVSALTDLVSRATTLITEVETKLASGAFIGPQGVSGVAVDAKGYFGLEVDSATGDLYFVSEDESTECPFVLDEDGNLFYEIKEG